MRACPGIIAAAWAVLFLSAGPARGQNIRPGHTTRDGAKVGLGERTEDPAKERERMRRGCERYLDKAEDLLRDGKYAPACRELARAKGLLVDRELARQYGNVATRLNQVGMEQLDKADQVFRLKEYPNALAEYKRIAATFLGLPVSPLARGRLNETESNPEVQAVLQEIRAAKLFGFVEALVVRARQVTTAPAATRPAARAEAVPKAVKVDAKAVKSLDDKRLLRAVDCLENIVKTCPGTPTADRSAGLLAALRSDPAGKARLDRLRAVRRADGALAKATTYHKAGLLAKAVELYRQVIRDHPRTPQAANAAVQLAAAKAQLANP